MPEETKPPRGWTQEREFDACCKRMGYWPTGANYELWQAAGKIALAQVRELHRKMVLDDDASFEEVDAAIQSMQEEY